MTETETETEIKVSIPLGLIAILGALFYRFFPGTGAEVLLVIISWLNFLAVALTVFSIAWVMRFGMKIKKKISFQANNVIALCISPGILFGYSPSYLFPLSCLVLAAVVTVSYLFFIRKANFLNS